MDFLRRYESDYSSSSAAIALNDYSHSPLESFRRIEDKFLVQREFLPQILGILGQRLDPSYLTPGTRFNAIESVYFDSDNLKIFRDHFENENKFKIRLRRYGPNGVWPDVNDPAHLEMKTKADGICHKFRLKVDRTETSILMDGRPLPTEYKKKKAKTNEKVAQINAAILAHGLKPVCKVRYERNAFERDGLRVTVDDQIQAQILKPVTHAERYSVLESAFFGRAEQMRSRFLLADYLVIEVKHNGTIPTWLMQFFSEIGCEPASFSKYCYSMINHLLER